MSRKGLTKVSQEKFLKICEKVGLTVVSNKGWVKCYAPGNTKGLSLGIPQTDDVTRVELVRFTAPEELASVVVPHPKPPAKTVEQMIDFSVEEKLILRAFYKLASHIKATHEAKLAEEAKAAEAAKQAEQAPAPTEAPAEQAAETVAQTA